MAYGGAGGDLCRPKSLRACGRPRPLAGTQVARVGVCVPRRERRLPRVLDWSQVEEPLTSTYKDAILSVRRT